MIACSHDCLFTCSLTHACMHAPTHTPTHALTHPHPYTHSPTLSQLITAFLTPTPSLTHSSAHPRTHPPTQSHAHCLATDIPTHPRQCVYSTNMLYRVGAPCKEALIACLCECAGSLPSTSAASGRSAAPSSAPSADLGELISAGAGQGTTAPRMSNAMARSLGLVPPKETRTRTLGELGFSPILSFSLHRVARSFALSDRSCKLMIWHTDCMCLCRKSNKLQRISATSIIYTMLFTVIASDMHFCPYC